MNSIINQSEEWFHASPYNLPYDVHLCSYSQLLRMVAGFHTQIYNGPLGLKPVRVDPRTDILRT
jgi:hypothetical protein